MKIYIYSYINKQNGHRYIGKTNNIERRKREHKSQAFNPKIINTSSDTMWYKKIRQYGLDQFDFEILEVANETNWAEREKYWIAFYNTYNGSGYNSTPGGDDNTQKSILNEEEVSLIIDRLRENNEAHYEIAIDFGISSTLLSNINHGLRYRRDDVDYPICKTYRTGLDEYSELIFLLRNSYLSFREIALQLNIAESTVKKINYGKLQYDPNMDYPIRKFDTRKLKKIHRDLMSNKTWNEVYSSNKYSKKFIDKINNGEEYFIDFLHYPLRS